MAFARLPELQKEIGRRVRSVRKRFDLSQGFLAPLLGLSRDQLNSVEIGRVALRFDPGITLCGELDLNPLWLAFGESPPAGFVSFDSSDILDDDLFSGAIERLRETFKKAPRPGENRTAKSEPGAATSPQISRWLPHLPPEDIKEFWREIDRVARAFLRTRKTHVKARLTTAAPAQNVDRMTWPGLRRRINLVTKKRGLKSQLARDARVSRQVVSAWLSGSGMPNAHAVFFLLEWVAAEEAKQKRAGRAETRPAQPTRKSKSKSHEKAKSDRKKS